MKRKIYALGIFSLFVISGMLIPLNFVEASDLNIKTDEPRETDNFKFKVDFKLSGVDCIGQSIDLKVGNTAEFSISIDSFSSDTYENMYVVFIPGYYLNNGNIDVYDYIVGTGSSEYMVENNLGYALWRIPPIESNVELNLNLDIVNKGVDETTVVIFPGDFKSRDDVKIYKFNINGIKDCSSVSFSRLLSHKSLFGMLKNTLMTCPLFEQLFARNNKESKTSKTADNKDTNLPYLIISEKTDMIIKRKITDSEGEYPCPDEYPHPDPGDIVILSAFWSWTDWEVFGYEGNVNPRTTDISDESYDFSTAFWNGNSTICFWAHPVWGRQCWNNMKAGFAIGYLETETYYEFEGEIYDYYIQSEGVIQNSYHNGAMAILKF